MTIEEQVKDAVQKWVYLMYTKDIEHLDEWFNSIPVEVIGLSSESEVENELLKWIPESHMNDHISGFIIQHKAIFDKWYETLKLNTKNDTTTTNSIT